MEKTVEMWKKSLVWRALALGQKTVNLFLFFFFFFFFFFLVLVE